MRVVLALVVMLATPALGQLPKPPNPLIETRYCGSTPERDDKGKIKRSRKVIAAFRAIYPCPETGRTTGACREWAIDHVIPLACGGCDAVSNMQWLPYRLKSASVIGKDRFERDIYCAPFARR